MINSLWEILALTIAINLSAAICQFVNFVNLEKVSWLRSYIYLYWQIKEGNFNNRTSIRKCYLRYYYILSWFIWWKNNQYEVHVMIWKKILWVPNFLLYLSNMLSTIGVKELRFYTWLTSSSIYFNCDKSCSNDSDELVNHQNRSDICWK